MINVMTWLWRQKGRRFSKYNAESVNVWARMVSRNLTIPHKISCVTNMPEGIEDWIEIIPLTKDFDRVESSRWREKDSKPQCYRRIDMFRPDAGEIYGERFVSMDLDCIVTGNLDPLFSRGDDFVVMRGTAGTRPYNGGMILMDAGARPYVYTNFTPELVEKATSVYVGSDQAWISFCLGWLEKTWDEEDGVYYFGNRVSSEIRKQGPPDDMRLLFFPGMPKPWELSKKHSWIRDNYC